MTSPQDTKRLQALVKQEDNRFCADCGCREPRWASANLGVFICLSCSGIHRNLGVHISFVRSVNLDSWKTEQIDKMERIGNARAKAYYLASVPAGTRAPTEHSSVREMERWIRDKYEHKKFISRGSPHESEPGASIPKKNTLPKLEKPVPENAISKTVTKPKKINSPIKVIHPPVDLLSFEAEKEPKSVINKMNDSFFGDFQGAHTGQSEMNFFGDFQEAATLPVQGLVGIETAVLNTSNADAIAREKTNSILQMFNSNGTHTGQPMMNGFAGMNPGPHANVTGKPLNYQCTGMHMNMIPQQHVITNQQTMNMTSQDTMEFHRNSTHSNSSMPTTFSLLSQSPDLRRNSIGGGFSMQQGNNMYHMQGENTGYALAQESIGTVPAQGNKQNTHTLFGEFSL